MILLKVNLRYYFLFIGIFMANFTAVSQQAHNPVANQQSIILEGNARFTILTPQLLRLEWSDKGTFEDRASLLFLNRNLPVPRYEQETSGNWLSVKTEKLTLRYKKNSGKFTKENLEITFEMNGKKVVWKPGMRDTSNLKGTTRTLDGAKGSVALEPGLLSREGWTVIDDSQRPLFDSSAWQWVMPREDTSGIDWYFFGYGHDYKKLLYDFTQIAGKIPLPPRFAFGVWWSRYWAYTDQELKELVNEFQTYNIPLDVLVIDMDWHQTFNLRWGRQPKDQAGQPLGWTGYTWDKNYFPDPEGFLAWCKRKGLKTTLNLHPASGIQPHEEHYPEMARAMGIDPASKKYVPFDIVDKQFTENYFTYIIRPLEQQGVDFWWLDWQQWGTTKLAGVNPTWWLNYVFFTDMERRGNERPIILHRWGGLGNHRYQIGFSGDTYSVWESLAFQPYFTATAANVCYGYWSHDIGGHLDGEVSPELYTRWIQFGVFSPILRTHTTKNPKAERRIWAYPPEYFKAMREAILLRYALIPYIYTSARNAYDTGISLCRPMYYEFPDNDEAYAFKDQYFFGSDMIVAPITEALDADTFLATKKIWLPKGSWYEWFTGTLIEGPTVIRRSFALDEIPVYVKAGAIIPMQPVTKKHDDASLDPLILVVFPGDSGSTKIYEDEGNSLGYQRNEYSWTTIHQTTRNTLCQIDILPSEGEYPGMVREREFELRLVGTLPPKKVQWENKEIPYSQYDSVPCWLYDGNTLTIIIRLPKVHTTQRTNITVQWEKDQEELTNGVRGLLSRLRKAMNLLNNTWPQEWSPDILVNAFQTGHRITLNPFSAKEELSSLKKNIEAIKKEIKEIKIDKKVTQRVQHLLKEW